LLIENIMGFSSFAKSIIKNNRSLTSGRSRMGDNPYSKGKIQRKAGVNYFDESQEIKKKRQKNSTISFIIILFLIIAIAAILSWYLFD